MSHTYNKKILSQLKKNKMNKYKLLILLLFIPIISTAQITRSTYRYGNKIYYVPIYSEQQARLYLDNAKELDPVEGIWISGEDKYSIEKDFDGFSRKSDYYRAVLLHSSQSNLSKINDIRFFLKKGTSTNIYETTYYSCSNLNFSSNGFTYEIIPTMTISLLNGPTLTIKFSDNEEYTFYKVYSPQNVQPKEDKKSMWTGTCFAIDKKHIVTNYHVIQDAKLINVKGMYDIFNSGHSAEVVASDKVNDIAILKITDNQFPGFGNIPYCVSSRMADVGEDIFVLGYPLTQTMGNEIKLTNGIISSRTGFQGDIANYQMSAPIQPGNSGGPMFDSKGDVIGIVCAHHAGAENAGYAIKISYLKLLIESTGLNIALPSNNTISSLSLPEKVKRLRDFVLYIECR